MDKLYQNDSLVFLLEKTGNYQMLLSQALKEPPVDALRITREDFLILQNGDAFETIKDVCGGLGPSEGEEEVIVEVENQVKSLVALSKYSVIIISVKERVMVEKIIQLLIDAIVKDMAIVFFIP